METGTADAVQGRGIQVLSLPMRDGNQDSAFDLESYVRVLSLPMRDGNRLNAGKFLRRRFSFEPTYEGWKLPTHNSTLLAGIAF